MKETVKPALKILPQLFSIMLSVVQLWEFGKIAMNHVGEHCSRTDARITLLVIQDEEELIALIPNDLKALSHLRMEEIYNKHFQD